MTSPQFISFLERKLKRHHVRKILPKKNDLQDAFRLFARSNAIETIVERELENFEPDEIEVPVDLEERVRKYLEKHPSVRWDAALAEIVKDDNE
jgi:hypothetical protein